MHRAGERGAPGSAGPLGRREPGALAALGAGLLACLPLLLLSLHAGGEPGLYLLVAPAGALSMWALRAAWRRGRWRPQHRAAWVGVFLGASLLGSALTGLLATWVMLLWGLVTDPRHFSALDAVTALPQASVAGALSGVTFGFLSLCAPLGGLLFVWLARRARYTSRHD